MTVVAAAGKKRREYPLAQPVVACWLVVDICTFMDVEYEPVMGLKGRTHTGREMPIPKTARVSADKFERITLVRSQDPNIQSNIKGVIQITVEDQAKNAMCMQFAVNTQCFRVVEMYCAKNEIIEKPGEMLLYKQRQQVQKAKTLQEQGIRDGDVLTIVVVPREQPKRNPPPMVTVATIDDVECGQEYPVRKHTGVDLLNEITGKSHGEIWVIDTYGNCSAQVPLNEPLDQLCLSGFSVAIKSC